MDDRARDYLREVFQGEPPIETDESGAPGLWMYKLCDHLRDRPEHFYRVLIRLFREHGADTWLWFRDEDLPYLDRAIHEIGGERN
jgi:hypothetical protein